MSVIKKRPMVFAAILVVLVIGLAVAYISKIPAITIKDAETGRVYTTIRTKDTNFSIAGAENTFSTVREFMFNGERIRAVSTAYHGVTIRDVENISLKSGDFFEDHPWENSDLHVDETTKFDVRVIHGSVIYDALPISVGANSAIYNAPSGSRSLEELCGTGAEILITVKNG